jgi:hypothetical protein
LAPPGLKIDFPNSDGILIFSLEANNKAIKVQHLLLVAWGRLKIFFCISALTPSVKPLVPISTFAPMGMFDLG